MAAPEESKLEKFRRLSAPLNPEQRCAADRSFQDSGSSLERFLDGLNGTGVPAGERCRLISAFEKAHNNAPERPWPPMGHYPDGTKVMGSCA